MPSEDHSSNGAGEKRPIQSGNLPIQVLATPHSQALLHLISEFG